jgi:sugar-specific transcriptional regulator TrmB
MSIMEKILEELGLTKLEVKVYLTLLNEGSNPAGEISKRTGIHRRNIYDALQRLSHKGLVGYIKENNKKIYSISNPEAIMEKLTQKQLYFQKIMPTLMGKYNAIHEESETLFYRGNEGVKLILEDQIRVKQEVLVNATSVKVSYILKHYFPKYQLLRKQNKIKTRMIFDTAYRDNKDNERAINYLSTLPLSKLKFVKDFNKSPMSQYIYGDNVAIVLWGENPVSILIRQKDIAQGFRDSFELIWKLAD